MDDKEQLKLTDFTDPLVQLAFGLAVFADLFFILIPIRYILAIIVAAILFPGMRSFVAKLMFIICLALPLPLATIGAVVGVLLSNAFVRTVAVQLGIAIFTGGVGTLAEAGAFALETAGKEVVTSGAEKAAEAVGGERAGQIAGVATGAAMAKTGVAAKGASAAAEKIEEAEVAAGAGAKSATGVGGAAKVEPKTAGAPAAKPEELPPPTAQPPETKPKSLKERAGEYAKRRMAEELVKEESPKKAQASDIEEVTGGDLGGPDVVNLKSDADVINLREGDDESGVEDLKRAA